MNNLENKLVADIVLKNIHTAEILKKYGIDYAIEGKKNLLSVCDNKGLDFKKIVAEIQSVHKKRDVYYLQSYNTWDLNFLIHFLSDIHHDYKEENILFLKETSNLIANKYGETYPEVKELRILIEDVTEDILEHMKNEEVSLFPYIKRLMKLKEDHRKIQPSFLIKSNAVDDFEDEHLKIRTTFNYIAKLTNNYSVPKNTCDLFKIFYIKLAKFDDELINHIHIENNILFPKIRCLEAKVLIEEMV